MIKFGLIGRELGHSFSKDHFTRKFHQLGLNDHAYELYPLAQIEDFPNLLESEQELRGLNVTIPYKRSILPYLDDLSSAAAEIGAVNTIQFESGKLIGHNTDSIGFEKSMEGLEPKFALVLGNGGASQAVQYVLKKVGIEFMLVSRKAGVPYAELKADAMLKADLIINTTSLGMSPHIDSCPDIDYSLLHADQTLIDLVYNPELTLFLKKGKEQGASIRNGLTMLYAQAEAAWNIWKA